MMIIMLGAPGTGKGTIAGILSKKLEIPQVSTGDIFRKNIKEKTELGKQVENYLAKGELVPDEITIQLVKNKLEEPNMQNGIILDGFPRTVAQAQALDEILENKNKKVGIVINLTTPKDEIIERIVNRRVCPECKSVYNLVLHPPKQEGICDKCGHELTQRKDDNRDTVESRLGNYEKLTSPLVSYYEEKGNLYSAVVSKSINKLGEDVAKDVIEYIKENNI